MARQYESEVSFVGVAVAGRTETYVEFVDAFGLGFFEHGVDDEKDVWAGYGLYDQPAWVFVNDDGVEEVVIATLGHEELEARIRALIDA